MPFLSLHVDFAKRDTNRVSRFYVQERDGMYVVSSDDGWANVSLRVREAYPVTFCEQFDDGTVSCGYGDPADPNAESLLVTISPNGTVMVARDTFVTLPIFYGQNENMFSLSSSYEEVVGAIKPKRINKPHVLNVLKPNPDYHQTLFEEVSILDERALLKVDQAGIEVLPPTPRSWAVTTDVNPTDPMTFQKTLSRHFDNFIRTRLEGQKFAFEVSGGLDSSLLPLYYRNKHHSVDVTTGTMIFPGEYATTQLEKLDAIQAGNTSVRVTINPETDFPLARYIRAAAHPFYFFEEIYTEPLTKLADTLASQGIQVVSTGIGGDEWFENNLSAEDEFQVGKQTRERRKVAELPSFLTDKFKKDWIESTPGTLLYPLPLLGMSLHGAQLARNSIYIERGIWPVSPYASAQMYEYCQGLPIAHRANKNIVRAFYEAYQFPQAISNPPVNENFGKYFEDCLLSDAYDEIIEQLAARSYTGEWGYVDIEQLLKSWNKKNDSELNLETKQLLLSVFVWVGLEINLNLINE